MTAGNTTEIHTQIERIRCNRIDSKTEKFRVNNSVVAGVPCTSPVGALIDAGAATKKITNCYIECRGCGRIDNQCGHVAVCKTVVHCRPRSAAIGALENAVG